MSYADAAAKGPRQTPQEAAAPQIPEVVPNLSKDLDSPLNDRTAPVSPNRSTSSDTRKREKLEKTAKRTGDAARELAERAAHAAQENSGHPVVVLNTVLGTIAAGALALKGYERYTKDALTWQVAGAWAAGVGAFSVANYYASRYVIEKYPQKRWF